MTSTTAATTATAATTVTNEKWILSKLPKENFQPNRDVELVQETINLETFCDDNDDDKDKVVVQVDTLSVDAFIRTMLDESAYHGSVGLGSTIPAFGYGTVVAVPSKQNTTKRWKIGQPVLGMMGAQTFAKVPASQLQRKHNIPFLPDTAPLGLMSLTTGLTAYAGVFFVCSRPPRKGETVVVTASAGAVGSMAAQLAKTTGAKVIGIAGNKNDFLLNNLKLDGAIDYKSKDMTLEEQLDQACPEGVDFVYDNVGGDTLDELLYRIRPGGRIVICGAISQYDSGNLNKVGEGKKVQGPSNYLKLAERGAEMKGFNVMQYMHKLPIAMIFLMWYYVRGKVKMTENIKEGIRSFPTALQSLFTGGNIGKTLVNV